MRVQYYDITRLSEDEEDALGVRFRLLRELLRTSDIVSLHVPLNASTRGMIGAGELALMKPTAILVNTSRGPVVDEPALTRALAAGKLFGAGLDVFDQEPPPADNPLLKLDNVVLTAHFAGPDLGQPRRPLPQRLRQRAARRPRRAAAVGRAGIAVVRLYLQQGAGGLGHTRWGLALSPGSSSGSPSESAPSAPGGGGKTLADCMGFWDRETHMTKAEWKAACVRTMQEYPSVLQLSRAVACRRQAEGPPVW